jgi:Cys-rich four helix bundle protein (predicted Tat secretion target)
MRNYISMAAVFENGGTAAIFRTTPTTEDSHMSDAKEKESAISRRDLLVGMGVAAMAYTPFATAMEHDKQPHAKHDHSKHKPQQPDVLDGVNACVDKGQRCIAHCLTMFQEGDLSVADCAAKVHEMLPICTAFSYLLSANSGHVPKMAELCQAVCTECAEECRKHDEHHECRECAEACEETVAAIKKTFG